MEPDKQNKTSFLAIFKNRVFYKQLVYAIFAMLLCFFLWLKYIDFYTLHDEYIVLPDFYGVHINDLDSVCQELDLRYFIIDSVFNKKVEKGTILEQDPIVGTKVKENRRVYFTINALQNKIVTFPYITDLSLRQTVRKLEKFGAMKNTIVVSAAASEPAPMQYIAPFSACSMGEYFRDKGEDALIVYDDLSKQAVAYRQISLLLRRPPGREAYPGDVFYLHSRLLERAARVSEEYIEKFTNGKVKGKTGSLTALPIVETQAGDISAFVPTNVISITDGQIFLEDSLFKSGLKPAMDPGISVSRVGGAAQVPIIKKLGAGIKTSLAQYRELEAFAQFASDLDEVSKAQLEHGMRVTELTKQAENSPMSVAEMGIVLYSVNEGYLKEVEVEKVKDFEKSLLSFMSSEYGDLMKSITISGDYNEEIENAFKAALDKFMKTQTW